MGLPGIIRGVKRVSYYLSVRLFQKSWVFILESESESSEKGEEKDENDENKGDEEGEKEGKEKKPKKKKKVVNLG